MIDFNAYVGIPYETADCWSLVEMVLAELEYKAPDLHSPSGFDNNLWTRVSIPDVGDVVAFWRNGHIYHVGIAISATHFLHTQENTGAIIEPIHDEYLLKRLEGIYRYEDCKGHTIP